MRIAFLGAGGVGGYFGGRLAAAGEDVTFLARGRHLDAMRREGLFLVGPEETVRVHPVKATDQADDIGPVELVVVAVKHWDLEEAARIARRLVGPSTEVVSFLNGVEAPEILAREVGRERVLGGVAYIVAWIEAPGRIRHGASIRRLALGGLDGRRSQTAEAFAQACARAGFQATLPPSIEVTLWEKFVLLSALSGVTAAARLPIGPLRSDPGARDLIARAMQETAALARARGVPLSEDAADRQLALCDRLPADSVSSMLTDLTRGNRLELPWLSGAVVRLGREAGVATPVHAFLSAILGPHAAGKP